MRPPLPSNTGGFDTALCRLSTTTRAGESTSTPAGRLVAERNDSHSVLPTPGGVGAVQRSSAHPWDRPIQFLTMMIEHHEGAIDMAKTEKTEGIYGPAKTLADDIITAQTAEIAQMKTILSKS